MFCNVMEGWMANVFFQKGEPEYLFIYYVAIYFSSVDSHAITIRKQKYVDQMQLRIFVD